MKYDELVKRLRCLKYGNCPACLMWYAEEVEPNLWRERCVAIDAADAIEELQEDKAALNETVTNLLEQIKDLSKPRWIPATERLPEEGVSVQVCFYSQGGEAQAVSERFVDNRNQSYWSGLCGMKPTHWMPLPQPPKGENE